MSPDWVFTAAKIAVVVLIAVNVVPIMVWVERRGSGIIQDRQGPNRVGPLGLIQSLADAAKFFLKYDLAPSGANRFFYLIAPVLALIPAIMTVAAIPFAAPFELNGYRYHFQLADLNVGILYMFAIASLGVYGIIFAGWASNSKYALFGSLRSSSQMISYELSLGLSIIGLLMLAQSVGLNEVVAYQGESLIDFGIFQIPRWGVFVQPLGFLIFVTAMHAETNRLPFDLPEGESEIVAGYHLEYGGMKFALFFMAEYINMFNASCLIATLFLGGYQLLPGLENAIIALRFHGELEPWVRAGFQFLSLLAKVGLLMWLFVWVRWTLPRFRYDQLMAFGWKVMLPLSLLNIFVTGCLVYRGVL